MSKKGRKYIPILLVVLLVALFFPYEVFWSSVALAPRELDYVVETANVLGANITEVSCDLKTLIGDGPRYSEHSIIKEVFWSTTTNSCLYIVSSAYLSPLGWPRDHRNELGPREPLALLMRLFETQPQSDVFPELLFVHEYAEKNIEEFRANHYQSPIGVWLNDFNEKISYYK